MLRQFLAYYRPWMGLFWLDFGCAILSGLLELAFPLAVRGFNVEGLRRRGFGPERIASVKQMHKLLYRQGLTLDAAKSAIEALRDEMPEAVADVDLMLNFLQQSTRGIAR